MHTTAPIILIADVDLNDLELLKDQLLQVNERIKVYTVLSGRETVQLLDDCVPDNPPHLIVLDYNIPDMNGLDIFRLVRASPSFQHISVVFWSTSTSPQLKATCEQAGAHSFVTKPTTPHKEEGGMMLIR